MRQRSGLSISQQGLSLVEITVALALSSVLCLALFEVFGVARKSFNQVLDANEMLDNAQLSFSLLEDSINMAGFFGGARNSELELIHRPLTSFPGECDSQWVLNLAQSLHGYDGGVRADDITGLPSGCLSDEYVPHSDVLVVRSASVLEPVSESKIDNKYYRTRFIARSSSDAGAVIFSGQDSTLAIEKLPRSNAIANYLLQVDLYFLEYCQDASVCDESGIGLSRYTLLGSRFVKQRLVNGIAQLQFEYGIDSSNRGKIDRYVTASEVNDWREVGAVRVFMLLRGGRAGKGYQIHTHDLQLGNTFQLEAKELSQRFRYKKFQSEFDLKKSVEGTQTQIVC